MMKYAQDLLTLRDKFDAELTHRLETQVVGQAYGQLWGRFIDDLDGQLVDECSALIEGQLRDEARNQVG